MPEVSVNVEVYCEACGGGLCGQTESVRTYRRGEPAFRVRPCEKCLERARSDGYDEGCEAGEAAGEKVSG